MGPATEIFQEGIRIPPVRIVRGGIVDREMLDLILLNVRTPKEREGDLDAQMGACRVGEQRILQVAAKYGVDRLETLVEELLDYSERLVRAELRTMPAGDFARRTGWTAMGLRMSRSRSRCGCASTRWRPKFDVDFAGSSAQVAGA